MGIWYNASLAAFAAMGSFLFGYDMGVMTEVIESKSFQSFFNADSSSSIIGAIISTFSGGAVFGSLMGGSTMDRVGRKVTVQIGAVIALVGGILQASAPNLASILVGRIFSGWAVGLMSMSIPVYQSECAHPDVRGLMVGITQQMIGIGYIVSTWISYGSSHVADTNSFSWRFPLAFQTVPCVVIVLALLLFPESPRYLLSKGKEEEALQVLYRLHYNGRNGEWVEQEFTEVKMTIEAERDIEVPGWTPMFTVPQWRLRLLHGTLVQVFTQMTGINVINYYQTTMYKNLGIVGDKNLLVTGVYNIVGPLTNLIFILFILDRVGRVKPLLFGAIGISIMLICESGIGSQVKKSPSGSLSIAGIFFIFMVSIIFSLSFGPISWVYMSEIMPMQIRAKGCAFATGIGNWLVSVFWAQISPFGLKKLGWKFYFPFVAWNLLVTVPTVFFLFKETKQRSLEEIDLLFGARAAGNLTSGAIEREQKRTVTTMHDDIRRDENRHDDNVERPKTPGDEDKK